ncbi:hypothetical protein HXX76_002726 [Chlamydomonas incerta]|uniref:Uncharacterized protein n=1 Tax=Chlamydomonas incerta TaxID=51695 RepID=A0A835TBX8_CHLIN|nr:hypothetical protein HXX76_002726 [Chlamydomonas incerta]|eukprot:KAG2442642.1 hypothetical protein HXX76_002726 [Chlamydomonas incerta]
MSHEQPQQQPQALGASELEEVFGPSIWESAAHAKIPKNAWEYHIRRQLNDAAYNHLEYVPYCSTMPVQPRCEEPKFMWKRKERH